MARDTRGPMTEEELAAASDAIQELRKEVYVNLAEDLGCDPEDYRVHRYFHLLTSLATAAKLSPMVGSKVTSRGADVVGVGYEAKTTASCTNLQKSPDKNY